ncbi:hypothetical protein ACTD5D_40155 [Nocardia takedensis]|uniref:hypothetical protein n=1 Tax=Nocardia takedensis TaxID=259390 RepID=UPI003F76070E
MDEAVQFVGGGNAGRLRSDFVGSRVEISGFLVGNRAAVAGLPDRYSGRFDRFCNREDVVESDRARSAKITCHCTMISYLA